MQCKKIIKILLISFRTQFLNLYVILCSMQHLTFWYAWFNAMSMYPHLLYTILWLCTDLIGIKFRMHSHTPSFEKNYETSKLFLLNVQRCYWLRMRKSWRPRQCMRVEIFITMLQTSGNILLVFVMEIFQEAPVAEWLRMLIFSPLNACWWSGGFSWGYPVFARPNDWLCSKWVK